jgi:hypothetical protein
MANGAPISAADAQILMDEQRTIVSTHRNDVMSLVGVTKGDMIGGNYYSLSKLDTSSPPVLQHTNCYIFDANLVTRYFNDSTENATHLLVLLGADTTGRSTVILVGCNKDKNGNFVSLKRLSNEPGSEHPPFTAIGTFPPHPIAGNAQISFEIK